MKINTVLLTTLILYLAVHSKTDPRTKPKKKDPVPSTQKSALISPKAVPVVLETVQKTQPIPEKQAAFSAPPLTRNNTELHTHENQNNKTTQPPADVPVSSSNLHAAHNYIVNETILVIGYLITAFENSVLPHLEFLKTQNSVSTTFVYLIYTFIFLKLVLLFKKKPRNSFDQEGISKELAKTISTHLASFKIEMDKSFQSLNLKTSELQQTIERFTAEKKDDEPLDFLVGNLGDLWKEIRDLKTRVNEVDAGGSNLISFNSKMEFKQSGKHDKGLNEELDDDSASRKFNLLDENNRILPKEVDLQQAFLVKEVKGRLSSDNQVVEDIHDVFAPIIQPNKNKKNEHPVILGLQDNPVKDALLKISFTSLSIAPLNEGIPSSLATDSIQQNSPPAKRITFEMEKTGIEFGRPVFQPSEFDFTKPIENVSEQATLNEPKVSLNFNRISVPTSIIPKNLKTRPPMVRALPPKAPSGNPVPKVLDSNNLI